MEVYTYDVPPTQAKRLMELGITANIDFWAQFQPRSSPAYRAKYALAVRHCMRAFSHSASTSKGRFEVFLVISLIP